MSTDRELLALAAKAAGIVSDGLGGCYDMDRDTAWNPLADDGDRLRLARRMGISIDFDDCCTWKHMPNSYLLEEFWGEERGDEANAVLRLVAEIGKHSAGEGREG